MTISSETSRISYTGDGSTKAFAVPFYFAANADLVVYLNGALQTLSTNYTLTGATLSAGGTCTFIAAPTTGYSVVIYRNPPATQTTSYNNNDAFPAKSHELALDKLTTLAQRTRNLVDRSIHLPDDEVAVSTVLGSVATRANKLLGFDNSGALSYAVGPTFVGTTSTGVAEVDSRATAQVTTFAASVNIVRTNGYALPGDGGGGRYKRVGSAPSHPGKFQSADSTWWELVESPVDIRMLGAKSGGSFDNYQAITDALSAHSIIYIPPGTWNFGTQIMPPTGSEIYGAGEGVTILQALADSHNGILIQDVNNVTVRDFSIIGVYNPPSPTGGIGIVRANYCSVDNVTIKNWSAQGLSLRFATYNQIGNITTIDNGDRGVNLSALSHHNSFGEIIATGNGLAAFLIGYGCYRNNVASVIGGGHQNSAIWIMCDCYENSIGRVNIAPPATSYEDNSAVVIAWHCYKNYIGSVIVRGWRRGIQFKAATVVPSGDGAIDPFITEGDTEANTIGSAYIETDGGTSAAGIYFDSLNSKLNKFNKVISLHVKTATYGVWDTIGDTDRNSFTEQTFDTVTTPFSLAALGTNTGLYRTTSGVGLDCEDPASPWHVRKLNSTGSTLSTIENPSSASNTTKAAGYEMRLRDTAATVKVAGRMTTVPKDADVIDAVVKFETPVASTLASRMQIGGGVYHASATGTDKGNNTINFGAVYDDNVLLTDYVFDRHLDGQFGDYSPRVSAVANELDPEMFDPAKYAAYWKEHRKLFGMPDLNDCIDGAVKELSLGAMIQKLWQTVELQAIHIDELRKKVEE